nr:porin [uncultured Caldimonas sp.]
MKRIALVAALIGASVPAFAQSNVTIYGRMNVTVERQKTGDDTEMRMMNNSSRIGFKGSEDLGGGLKANFLLEHGLSPDTGAAAATFWGRESWVGLSGGFGALRLGNMPSGTYFASADYVSMHNHDTGTSADALYAYLMRDTNKISYMTPNFGGFVGELQYSLKEADSVENAWEVSGNYDLGPLHLGGGYVKNGDDKLFVFRGLYELGAFTVGGYYERDSFDGDKRNNFRVSGMYTMGASELHANVGIAGDTGDQDDTGAKQYTLGYNYNLSKRTKVYGYYTRLSPDTGDKFSSFAVGVRHNF